jgi:hydroxymethylpyrimidine pyrophosphatase-like HAD family hydrolase
VCRSLQAGNERRGASALAEPAAELHLSVSVVARPVYAFSVVGVERQRLEPVAEFLSSSGAQVVLFAEPRFGGFSLIVNPSGVSKWSGVDTFCRRAGISAFGVLAVGDGDNDLPMLEHSVDRKRPRPELRVVGG